MRTRPLRLLLSAASFLVSTASAFYLPGVAPTTYTHGEIVPLQVNNLSPSISGADNQVRSVFSFFYYKPEFHFCRPAEGPHEQPGSLGSILFGDRIFNSPFELKMATNETCKPACGQQTFSRKDASFVNERIQQGYEINWYIDGLPAGQIRREVSTGRILEFPGFPLGNMTADGRPVLHNHYDILVDYHETKPGQYRVVGAIVQPESIGDSTVGSDGKAKCGSTKQSLYLDPSSETTAAYTYSVFWRPSKTSFATRWDKYLHVYDPHIHWLSLANSIAVVGALVGIVFTSLFRNIRRDLYRYNQVSDYELVNLASPNGPDDDVLHEDSGWKLIHGDVFRSPTRSLILSVLVGNGMQLLAMTGLTIVFAALGFLSPSNRGSLSTAMVMLYIFLSFVGGYASSRVYHFFNGQAYRLNILVTPLTMPTVVFGTAFLLNLVVWARDASGAIPFGTMLFLVALWLVLSIPLSFAGSWVALKQQPIQGPTKTNPIPRLIPASRGCSKPIPTMLMLGVLPFGAIFVELFFIINSIWSSKFYYMFGFLFLCFGMMVLSCATITILYVYYSLCVEDYRWQWASFFTAGTTAVYVFLFMVLYWLRSLSFSSWTSGILYLGYSVLMSVMVFVLTGSVGFVSAWFFVLRLYRSVRID